MSNIDVLFLDLDGVLNNNLFFKKQRENPKEYIYKKFCQENIRSLEELCRILQIKEIVITSTWRMGRSIQDLRDMLSKDGFQMSHLISDKTDEIGGPEGRAGEIRAWIEVHDPKSHLIIDDNPIGDTTNLNYHRVNSATGICQDDISQLAK